MPSWQDYFPPSQSANYSDPRWQKRRLEVLQNAHFKCARCYRDSGEELHVHHVNYRKGVALWEYGDDDLMCLCGSCHRLITERIRLARTAISTDDADTLREITGMVEQDLRQIIPF